MKKAILSVAVAGVLALGVASQASALTSANYLDSLTRVVYNSADVEVVTDLGKSAVLTTNGGVDIANGGFSLDNFVPGTTWSDINLGYFSYKSAKQGPLPMSPTNYDLYFTSFKDNMTLSNFNDESGTNSWFGSASGIYTLEGVIATAQGLSTGTTVELDPANANSFTTKMKGGQMGSVPMIFDDSGVINLASFDAAGIQTVDMYLYHIQKLGSLPWTLEGNTAAGTNYAAVITTSELGTTTVSVPAPAQTPVPAAAWLLGSGLFGLLGIRRKEG